MVEEFGGSLGGKAAGLGVEAAKPLGEDRALNATTGRTKRGSAALNATSLHSTNFNEVTNV